MKLHFLGGVLGAIGGAIGKTAGAVGKALSGPGKAGASVAKAAAKAPVKLGEGAKAITSPARDKLAAQAGKVGKGGGMAKLQALSKGSRGGTTDAPPKKTFAEKYGPPPALPTFTPDYGIQAQPSVPQSKAPLQLRGMNPVGGNPLHYHTHKAGEKVPKSSTPKMGVIGSGKRSSKSTCHYKSK